PLANAMNQLALETGGEHYFDFTNFLAPLKEVAKENNGYYLPSYAATHGADKSRFQKGAVGPTNPESKRKTREGYHAGRARRGGEACGWGGGVGAETRPSR